MQVLAAGPDTVVRFSEPRLDGAHLDRVLPLADRPRLRLDFRGVEDLTGNVLARLVSLHTRVRAAGGELTLEHVAPAVYKLFEVTRLTSVLNVRRQEAALSKSA
jgi:anti-anti-sigma regulatory factor